MPRTPTRSLLRNLTSQLALVAGVLAAWQLASVLLDARYLPGLERILAEYWALIHGELLVTQVWPSVYRLSAGLLLGVTFGVVVGIGVGYLRWLDPWVRPVLEFLRALPAVALLPGALLLFGATDFMRVSIIALGCTFPVLLTAIDGARRVEPLWLDVARMSGVPKKRVLAKVILPASLPAIFAGIRVSLAIALIMMVISELLAANDGLGFYILRNQRLFRITNVYAGVLVMGTLAWAYTTIVMIIERRVLRWHRGWRQQST